MNTDTQAQTGKIAAVQSIQAIVSCGQTRFSVDFLSQSWTNAEWMTAAACGMSARLLQVCPVRWGVMVHVTSHLLQ